MRKKVNSFKKYWKIGKYLVIDGKSVIIFTAGVGRKEGKSLNTLLQP